MRRRGTMQVTRRRLLERRADVDMPSMADRQRCKCRCKRAYQRVGEVNELAAKFSSTRRTRHNDGFAVLSSHHHSRRKWL